MNVGERAVSLLIKQQTINNEKIKHQLDECGKACSEIHILQVVLLILLRRLQEILSLQVENFTA